MSDAFATFQAQFKEILQQNDRYVICSHIRPDGDAVGSQLALGAALAACGKSVRLLNEDGMPENLLFLNSSELAVEPTPTEPLSGSFVAIVVDTAERERVGSRTLAVLAQASFIINIDHHLSNPSYGHFNLVVPSAPAAGQIIYKLLKSLELPIPPLARDAIYVAISTDTGSFQYPSTTAETYTIAAELVAMGLCVGKLNDLLYHEYPLRRIELLRALLQTLMVSACGRIASWHLPFETRRALGLKPEDSEGLIDHIRALRGVVVAVFFEELGDDGLIRVSLRSKGPNVCEVAQAFGGGGHALAAGIRMPGPLACAQERVLAALEHTLSTGLLLPS